MLFAVVMLYLPVVIQAKNCNTTNYLALNYLNPINDTSTIVGVTSACTVFVLPGPLISNSNFLKELEMIDSDRKKTCYGVNVHILQNKKLIVFFLRMMRFAILVNCAWKFSETECITSAQFIGKLLYCNADYNQLLFVYEQQKACTNLIQFDKGFSFFCAVSDRVFEKITYVNNDRHIKHIRTSSGSLFLKENSDVVLVTKSISGDAGYYELNVFDNVYVEQLANNEIHTDKGHHLFGLLEPKKYDIDFIEIHKKNLGNISSSQDLPYIVAMHQTTLRQMKCGYMEARRYKKEYLKKFVLRLYNKIAESGKQFNIYKESMVRYGVVDNEVRLHYIIRATILMTPTLTVLSIIIILIW